MPPLCTVRSAAATALATASVPASDGRWPCGPLRATRRACACMFSICALSAVISSNAMACCFAFDVVVRISCSKIDSPPLWCLGGGSKLQSVPGIGALGIGSPGGAIFAFAAAAPVGFFACPVGCSGGAFDRPVGSSGGGRGIASLKFEVVDLCSAALAAPACGAFVLEHKCASECDCFPMWGLLPAIPLWGDSLLRFCPPNVTKVCPGSFLNVSPESSQLTSQVVH